MNKREEDRLIEMVFGELNPNDESVLSHRVASDEELAAFASEWEELRDDLKSLKDIPEMQLSSERLRDAILGQGLRPEPAINWWNFAWVPVAACLALLIVVPSIRGNKTAPMIVMNDTPLKSSSVLSGAPKLELPRPKDLVITIPPVAPTVAKLDATKSIAKPTVRLALAERPGSFRKAIRSTEAAFQAPISRSNSARGTAFTGNRDAMAKSQFDSAMTLAGDTSAPTLDDSVVLIEPGTDASTGASKATELASISNVVVGG